MNFIALDFETANAKRDSACALGIVKVKDGVIIDKKEWLIKPPIMYFHPINIGIHGIQAKDVKNKASFDIIWNEIKEYIDNKIVIAHNASFDMSVLRACMETYNIEYPEFKYMCTVQVSKALWPQLENHKLNNIADYFNIKFKHHDALDDTITCAQIAIKACQKLNCNSIYDLASKINIKPGEIFPNKYKAPKKISIR